MPAFINYPAGTTFPPAQLTPAWVRTRTTAGAVDISLTKPDPASIAINALACSLSRIPRFNGHAKDADNGAAYSIAHHSLAAFLLAQEIGHRPRLQALVALHDFHEAIIGDIITPVATLVADKERLGALKWLLDTAIYEAAGLAARSLPESIFIERIDEALLRAEWLTVMPQQAGGWEPKRRHGMDDAVAIKCVNTAKNHGPISTARLLHDAIRQAVEASAAITA